MKTQTKLKQHLISLYNEANEQTKEIAEQFNVKHENWDWNYFIDSFENLDPEFYEQIRQFKTEL